MRQLLTLEQVADWLSVPKKTLYAQRSRGEAPGALGFKIGAHVRFDPADIEAHIATHKETRRLIADTTLAHALSPQKTCGADGAATAARGR
jgi:predicted DNA-binding transcriptional regulator AlpA